VRITVFQRTVIVSKRRGTETGRAMNDGISLWRRANNEACVWRRPEIPDARAHVARRAAAAATSVSGQRILLPFPVSEYSEVKGQGVLGGEGELREVAARQVALDDDVASR